MAPVAATACGPGDEAARPQTEPVEPGATATTAATTTDASDRTFTLGEKFTISWSEPSDPGSEINLTLTVTGWRCGDKAMPDLQRAAEAAEESYGEYAEPSPEVDAGYQLCVAALKVSKTGKKHAQHEPAATALDGAEVEYNQDDALTTYIGNGATYRNRERYGGAGVGLNPRETAGTAAAFQIPADTAITHLRYKGSGLFEGPPTSTALVKVAQGADTGVGGLAFGPLVSVDARRGGLCCVATAGAG